MQEAGSNVLRTLGDGESILREVLAVSWCEENRDTATAIKALAELRHHTELRAKIEGDLDERSITVTAIPEWRDLRNLLLDALAQHPQAKLAVMRALEAYSA